MSDPRGFTPWEHEPDEFDLDLDDADLDGEDEFDCHMGPGGYCALLAPPVSDTGREGEPTPTNSDFTPNPQRREAENEAP